MKSLALKALDSSYSLTVDGQTNPRQTRTAEISDMHKMYSNLNKLYVGLYVSYRVSSEKL